MLSIYWSLTKSLLFIENIFLKILYIQKTSCGSLIKISPSEGLLFSEDFQSSFLFIFLEDIQKLFYVLKAFKSPSIYRRYSEGCLFVVNLPNKFYV